MGKDRSEYLKEYYQKNKERLAKKYLENSADIKQKRKKYYKENLSKVTEKSKEYYRENSNRIKDRQKSYNHKNRESINAKTKIYYQKNKEKIAAQQSLRYQKHKERLSAIHKEYQYNRLKTDPIFKLLHILRKRLCAALKSKNIRKVGKTIDLLGCSIEQFKNHLQAQFKEGMSWDNHSPKGWHIDHIKPCASFDLSDPEQQKECFHYTNLQPLWWLDNMKKSDIIPT